MTGTGAAGRPEEEIGLRYWAPDGRLGMYFGSMYLFTSQAPGYRGIIRADMPHLRFLLSSGGHYEFGDGRHEPIPPVGLLGPTMRATRFVLDGPARVIGVPLKPLGWEALGCGSAHLWTDRLYDGAAVRDTGFATMRGALVAAGDEDGALDAVVLALWAFLARRLTPVAPAVARIVSLIDHWLLDGEVPRIERIVARSGLSARQLARYTNRLYGAPPKLLARKYRALSCAPGILVEKKNWTDLCDGGGFYDQSHFIREIKQFLGYTPNQLLHGPEPMARMTVNSANMVGNLTPLDYPDAA